MKNLITVLVFSLLTANLFASESNFVELNKGDVALSKVTRGNIISVDTDFGDCPPPAMCLPRTVATVEFVSGGCFDRVVAISSASRYNSRSKKYELIVSGINVHNKMSMVSICTKMSSKIVKLHVGAGFLDESDVELIILK